MKKILRYVFYCLILSMFSWGIFTGSSHLWDKWQFKRNYRAAERGDLAAQNRVGRAYSLGKVVTQNDALSVHWYRKAAEQGYPNSQHNLAWRYANGRGLEQDFVQAVQWYLKAAEQGYVNSMINLGNCYAHGNGVEWDKEKALFWYQKGAELVNKMAQHHLADLYLNIHRLKDEAKARYWFEKSSQQGYAESQYKLARLYLAENGRFGRDAEAVSLLKKAGKQGIPQAYTLVGMAYLNGRGVAQSKIHASRYFLLAVKGGHLNAGKFLLPCILPVKIK